MTNTAIDVLYVITDLQIGGVPLHLLGLAREMTRRSLQCHVASLAPPGPVAERLGNAGVPVSDCNARGRWDFGVIDRLAERMGELNPSCVHSFLFHANLASRLAWKSVGGLPERLLCEIQTVEVERRWHLLMERYTHHLSCGVICNSPSVVDHLARHAGVPADRLILIRGGVDVDRVRAATPADRARLGLREYDKCILWVGRLDPVKGLQYLIPAFSALPESPQTKLLLVGEGPFRSQVESEIENRNCGDRVRLLGARNDIPSLLNLADLFVFPSRTEGLPNALLEAMAAGCPIVATDVPGNRDLIEHERSGLLVPYGDTAALTAAMHRVLTDGPTAKAIGRRAADEVAANWNISSTYDRYETLYR